MDLGSKKSGSDGQQRHLLKQMNLHSTLYLVPNLISMKLKIPTKNLEDFLSPLLLSFLLLSLSLSSSS